MYRGINCVIKSFLNMFLPIFQSPFFQISRTQSEVIVKVYQEKLIIEGFVGFEGRQEKMLDFIETNYCIEWDYDMCQSNYLKGFTLCQYGQRLYQFQGESHNLTELRSVLRGRIGFFNWEKEVSFKKWIKKTEHCEIFQVLRGENQKVIKVLQDNDSNVELLVNQMLNQKPHVNLLHSDEFYKDELQVYLLMDFHEQSLGDLQNEYSKKRLPINILRPILQQLLEGVNHLHSHKIIHKDLKYDNVLITQDGTVKIIDFGLSQIGEATNIRSGTGGYIAPEVFLNQAITSKSDIFSIGVIFHKLLTGKGIYNNLNENMAGRMKISSHIKDKNAKDLLLQMLNQDPNLRYSAEDCLAHPFFTGEYDQPSQKVCLSNYLSPLSQYKFQPVSIQMVSLSL
ncbi:unnamed protein product (macronuclear) [Paramecium tetraurelia]|uniref:Protein kinase domain-containing protein n=1 Tax=Paramecium tetraurelia TaxID=5888 RepID=A0D882_PARTE|nr:uncharacterized protein GSPATT00014216001 [Paramecium tetraurelia]CAK79249.1 unnamed protein product [Paramecium tetraurelia]|eukprot:XP_001446646.1 hypothetical protein (macronuclear) [Paramecium tetraurelia strain d4-2]